MSATGLAWAAVGVVAGGLHATALWRAAHRIVAGGFCAVLRMFAVLTVLVGAAYAGGLLPEVAGWVVGLLAASVLYVGAERWSM